MNLLIFCIQYSVFCSHMNDVNMICIHNYTVYFLQHSTLHMKRICSVFSWHQPSRSYRILTWNISIFIRCVNNNLYILKWLWTAYKRRWWSWCDHNETNFNPNSTFMYFDLNIVRVPFIVLNRTFYVYSNMYK